MLRFIFLTTIIFLINAFALSAITSSNAFFGCTSKTYLDDAIAFVSNKDYQSLDAYFKSGKCMDIPNKVTVTVTDYGAFSGRSEIVFRGTKVWVVNLAIKLNK